jgi:hypothetical protein
MIKTAIRLSLFMCVFVSCAFNVDSQNIPNITRARIASNEASAVGALRTLSLACDTYKNKYRSFPIALTDLGPGHAELIDALLAGGKKSGYVFSYLKGTLDLPNGETVPSFSVYAYPTKENETGVRRFYIDSSGAIYVQIGAPILKE